MVISTSDNMLMRRYPQFSSSSSKNLALGCLCCAAFVLACASQEVEHLHGPTTPPAIVDCEVSPVTVAAEGRVIWGGAEFVPINLEDQAVKPNLVVASQIVYIAFEVQTKKSEGRFILPVDIYVIEGTDGTWSDPDNISRSMAPPSTPVLGVGLDGDVHVVWGEKHDGDSEAPPSGQTAMLYVNNESGTWSSPDTLWFGTNTAGFRLPRRPVPGIDGTVHLVFTPSLLDHRGIMHMRRAGGTWSEPAPVPGLGMPDLAFDGAGRMVMALIEADTSAEAKAAGADINSLFVTNSDDAGATWAPPTRILRSGTARSYDPRIAIGGDGTLHVIWTRDIDGDIWPDVLQHSYSSDGICWSTPATIPTPPGTPGPVEVAADRTGGLHIVYNHWAGPFELPSQAHYLYWDGTAWSEPERLLGSDMIGQRLSLYRDDSGTLHLAVSGEVNGIKGIHYATAHVAEGM